MILQRKSRPREELLLKVFIKFTKKIITSIIHKVNDLQEKAGPREELLLKFFIKFTKKINTSIINKVNDLQEKAGHAKNYYSNSS